MFPACFVMRLLFMTREDEAGTSELRYVLSIAMVRVKIPLCIISSDRFQNVTLRPGR
jgi:hypothetical protein